MANSTGEPPYCKCGCDEPVTWDKSQQAWHKYVAGHYRRDAPYMNEEWLRNIYAAGLNVPAIAKQCGVTPSNIRIYFRRFGIERRSYAEQWRMDRERDGGASRCDLCGVVLGHLNTLGVCLLNETCEKEYRRRHRQQYKQDLDTGRRAVYPSHGRVSPYVYGLHFPGIGTLKIGTSTFAATCMLSAKSHLRKKGLDHSDATVIWTAPGHHLTEAYIQANLAFSLPPRLQNRTRISEWFDTCGASGNDLAKRLDGIYGQMPPMPLWAG